MSTLANRRPIIITMKASAYDNHKPGWADELNFPARATQMPQAGQPGYDWQQEEPISGMDVPVADATFTPMDPTDMYRYCLGWVSYPYGVPTDMEPARPKTVEKIISMQESVVTQASAGSWSNSKDKLDEVVSSEIEDSASETPSSVFSSDQYTDDGEEDSRPDFNIKKKQIFTRYAWGA
eukprot:GHVH01001164.1.p1 GENE.GHVH01001164.1~~GHVH01001164.1.p1  ORF type:complete len:180 (+),score=17.85 GHVH01001164.1:103-642(+)